MDFVDKLPIPPAVIGISPVHVDRPDKLMLCTDDSLRHPSSGHVRLTFTDRAFPDVPVDIKGNLQICVNARKASDNIKVSWAADKGWTANAKVSLEALQEALSTKKPVNIKGTKNLPERMLFVTEITAKQGADDEGDDGMEEVEEGEE